MSIRQEVEDCRPKRSDRAADEDAEKYARKRDADLDNGKNPLRHFDNLQSCCCILAAVIGEPFQAAFMALRDGGFHQSKKAACRHEEQEHYDEQG